MKQLTTYITSISLGGVVFQIQQEKAPSGEWVTSVLSKAFDFEEIHVGAKKDGLKVAYNEILSQAFDPMLRPFGLSVQWYREYLRLNKYVYGTGGLKSLFVVMDPKNTDHVRLVELSAKVLPLHSYLVKNRNHNLVREFIELFAK